MIRPITFEEQIVGSRNDGGVYRNIYPHDGILWGCGITVTSTQIEIASGMFVLGGRMIWVDGKTVFEVKNPIQNGYARLKAKIDLNATTTQEECGQFATEMEFSTTELFPGLTQEDINSTGKIYEQELAVVKIEAGNVTGIVKKLENAGIDAEKLGGETPGYYAKNSDMNTVLSRPEIKAAIPMNGVTLGTNWIWEDEKTVFIRLGITKENDGINNQMKVASIAGLGIELPEREVFGSRSPAARSNGTVVSIDPILMPTGEIRSSHLVNVPVRTESFFIVYPKGVWQK